MPAVDISTAAGTSFAVSAALPATYDAAGYEALTWSIAYGAESVPELGSSRSTITFSDMATASLLKARGQEDPGSMDIPFAQVAADAGQAIIKAAYDATLNSPAEDIAIRVMDAEGNATYVAGKVTKWAREWGGNESFIMRNASFILLQGTYHEEDA